MMVCDVPGPNASAGANVENLVDVLAEGSEIELTLQEHRHHVVTGQEISLQM